MVSDLEIAIKTLHKLLIHGRTMAFEGTSSERFARFFDDLELLPAMLMESRNSEKNFCSHLEQMCVKFNCEHIFTQYKNKVRT